MVTFVSIILWLTVGLQPIEVAVEGPVSSVELLLDGNRVGVATAPEWRVVCDFGPVLRPHELVAVAYSASGAELGRARQVVNLPRPHADVKLVLEGSKNEPHTRVRVVAQSAQWDAPEHIAVTFDGQPLAPVDGVYPLPAYDPETAHILSAEAFFPFGVSARDDLTLGGPYGGRVASELTAVAVEVTGRRRPQVADFDGLLMVDGVQARVAAVERPGARAFLVRDHGAWESLRSTGVTMTRFWPAQRRVRLESGVDLTRDLHRFNLVVPNAVVQGSLAVFPVAGPFHLRRYNLAWLASHVVDKTATLEGQELAAAVAVAGVRAARESSPRAVVLVVSDGARDFGRERPEDIRAYLRALHVPLVVWTTGENTRTPWGTAKPVGSPKQLMKASEDLMKPLLKQWIVWVEGRHLPSSIELRGAADRYRLAGSGAGDKFGME